MAQAYRYALLGIVGLVTLVALFAIIRLPGQFTVGDENLIGQGFRDISEQSIRADTCGARAQQTSSCYGANACCGGQCVALSTCEGKPNGKVSTCGDRQLYCCSGKLSLKSCGISCSSKLDCPTIACIKAPCPQYECIDNLCLMSSPPPIGEPKLCGSDLDCGVNCFQAPCPQYACIGGVCSQRDPADACKITADCALGEVCRQGVCVAGESISIDDPIIDDPVGEAQ